jgi:ribonuclease P protein component
MLSSSNRLTSPAHFREVVRRGRRRGGHLMVVHLRMSTSPVLPHSASTGPRVGFVVSKAVGPAVTRNLVKRRLRHLCRERLPELPSGSMLVIRALPAAAEASYAELAEDLDRCLATVAPTTDVATKAVIGR